MAKPPKSQLDLFGAPEPPLDSARGERGTKARGVQPAPQNEEVAALSDALPAGIHMGTSSWSFPGWAGIVYDGEHGEQKLAREGLAAYARHPLFRSVGIDRTFYGPILSEGFAKYAEAVPEGFRFLVKAHEYCTQRRFPNHPRYGARRGSDNPFFLDPAYATDVVVAPMAEGLGAKAGPLVFQFSPQAELSKELDFPEALHRFLSALPKGPLYAVELRNPALLTDAYAQVLQSTGAAHCYNAWSGMPTVLLQRRRLAAPSALVVRWLLAPHLSYEPAKERYAPFNALVDPDEPTRDEVADLVLEATDNGRPGYVIVNNKAEGSSPLSVVALARRLFERRRRK